MLLGSVDEGKAGEEMVLLWVFFFFGEGASMHLIAKINVVGNRRP